MQSIKDIRSRLQGLDDIKHLLRSVRAMSAIRWRRAKKHLEVAQEYTKVIDTQLGMVFSRTGFRLPGSQRMPDRKDASTDDRTKRHQSGGIGLITLTSDRGLCGSFNTGLINMAMSLTNSLWKSGKRVRIISLGGYGERLLRNAGYQLFQTEELPSSQAVSFVNFRRVISHIKAFYESNVIDELMILYNQFNYFGSYSPKKVQLLPPKIDPSLMDSAAIPEDLMLNGDVKTLQTFLLWEHLAAKLYLAFIESTMSEHSARLQTMDSAISNLEERASELEIKYHSIRQEKITQAVLELQGNLRGRHGKK